MAETATSATARAPHVVIVGGGFAGLRAARTLAAHPVRITLLDRRNYHLFQPLLYQVATAALSPGEIAAPIRSILRRHRNVRVWLADVVSVDVQGRRVILVDGELTYDYLILAGGASHAYFGHDEWAPLAPGLKSIEDALDIRRRILSAYEAAEREVDPARRAALLTFVVVGGGPTGVELAGSLGVDLDRQGRVPVEPDLSVPGHPEVLVAGDLALFTHQGGQPLPGTAPVAMQQGRRAADNIWRSICGRPRRRFHYVHRGSMATIGRAAAVAEFGPLHVSGFVAWVSWLVVHIYFLIGFENRILVLLRWAWAYFSYQRGARLITGSFEPRPAKELLSGRS